MHDIDTAACGQRAPTAAKLVGKLNPKYDAAWEAQLARLAAYNAAHGDCSVPKFWATDPGLGTWVSKQRTLKGRLDRGEPSEGMTAERAARLTALGLVWNLVGTELGRQDGGSSETQATAIRYSRGTSFEL